MTFYNYINNKIDLFNHKAIKLEYLTAFILQYKLIISIQYFISTTNLLNRNG